MNSHFSNKNDITNEHDIIRAVLTGDKESFSILVNRYKEKVRNLIYLMTGDRESVDDLSQDVFLKVYESLRFFQFRSSFYTWIYKITVNTCRDEIRKKKIRKFIPIDHYFETNLSDSSMPDDYNKIDNRILVKEALNALKYDHKEILILKEIQDLSYNEISEILNCEIGTVKSKLSRARLELAGELKKMTGKKDV